ncbi:MAG: 50S ribosomal protein L22 [Patescibacteria group bacterium]|jgi:large subunit ribosomal protein L22
MDITAKARFIRMSPRKVRLVADSVRGLVVSEALARLSVMKQQAATPITKLLKSAIANAEHNFKISADKLFVKTLMVDGGPVYKRWTPKAFGSATPIRHRTSHLSLVLSEKEEVKKDVVKAVEKKTAKKK